MHQPEQVSSHRDRSEQRIRQVIGNVAPSCTLIRDKQSFKKSLKKFKNVESFGKGWKYFNMIQCGVQLTDTKLTDTLPI